MASISYPQAKILIVDDDPDVRSMVQMLLKLGGYTQIKAIDSAREINEILTRQSYDVILLDWRMPDVSGITVLEQIRKTSTIPVIMMTNENHRDKVEEAIQKGVTDYLIKPFSAPILLSKLDRVLQGSLGHA